jgi:N-acyl-L-homoserine lactone synthetase
MSATIRYRAWVLFTRLKWHVTCGLDDISDRFDAKPR